MTDKQIPNERRLYEYKSVYPEKSIIIDGVDVSACKWFTHNQLCECAIKPADDFHCHANPDCHYKKWQYKEQECEELKRELIQYEKDVKDLNYFAIKLKNCLTEIKDIAEHCIKQDICTTCNNSDRCHIEDEEIPTYDVCKLILQKISECEGNDEQL